MLNFFIRKFLEKKKLFLLLIIFSIFLLSFLLLSFYSIKRPEVDLNQNEDRKENSYNHISLTKEDCEKMEGKRRDVCNDKMALRRAVSSKNSKNCLNIKNIDMRYDCFLNLFHTVYEDDELCYKILDKHKKLLCLDRIIIGKKDEKICDKYFIGEPFEYQECFDRVMAFKISESGLKNDILRCREIKTLEYPNLCYMYSFKNKFDNNCQEVPDELKDLCNSFVIANYGGSVDMCDYISIKEYQDYCYVRFKIGGGDIRDAVEFDSDGDGVVDGDELFFRTDMHKQDTDEDGLTDKEELREFGTNPVEKDTDSDGLSDYDEINKYKTDPNKTDTDGDGISDGDEVKNGTDTNTGDSDKDGLLDIDEEKFGTDKNNPDTDGDGMSDLEETRNGYDPLILGQDLSDTDSDGLLDVDEIFYGTDRFNPDTDGDGIGDKEEVDNLTNPLGDGDMDFDGDGLSDKDEEKYGTNPTTSDIDRDGLTDTEELFIYKTDPNKRDTDGDGYSDGEEVRNGYNPLSKD